MQPSVKLKTCWAEGEKSCWDSLAASRSPCLSSAQRPQAPDGLFILSPGATITFPHDCLLQQGPYMTPGTVTGRPDLPPSLLGPRVFCSK